MSAEVTAGAEDGPTTPDRLGRLRLGWQYAIPQPDPGPPPRRPTPPEQERLDPDWAAAQRRAERHLNRPLRVALAVAGLLGALAFAAGAASWLNVVVAGLGVVCCALVAAVCGYALWQGRRALRSRLADERARVSKSRAAQERSLFAWQEEHARRMRRWQALRVAYEHQKRWYAVCAPGGVPRVDVAGGTVSGWSALLTTAGAPWLAAGGEVTVIDLSAGLAAGDLIGFARAWGIEPRAWVLPDDLAALDVGRGLRGDALADVLWQAAAEDQGSPVDHAILERVIDTLGGQASVARVAAALRALARIGDPGDDVAAGLLTGSQVDRLGVVFGRGAADRVVRERAWVLEAQLRRLAGLGPEPAAGRAAGPAAAGGPAGGALRVAALSPRAGAADTRVLASYLAAALAHELREKPRRRHTVFLLAADRLRGDTLDRLRDACQATGTGLVLTFRAIPPGTRERLGHGNAAVGYMRLPDAADATAASERIGAGRRFVLCQLTETLSEQLTEASGEPAGAGQHESVGAAIGASTAWGTATAKAASDAELLSRTREVTAGQHELQRLPASAMILTQAGQAVMCDVNPGLGALAAATERTLEESGGTVAGPAPAAGPAPVTSSNGAAAQRPRPNVGPPPARLDWRRRRP